MNFTPLFILSITSLLSITSKCSDSSSSEENASVSFASTSSDGSSFESLGDDKSSIDSMIEMTKNYQRKLAQKKAAKEAKEGKPNKGKKSKKVATSSVDQEEEEDSKEEEPQLRMEQALDYKNYILQWNEEIGDTEILSLVSEESSDCDGSCLDDFSSHSDVEDDIQRKKELLRADRLLKSSLRESSSAEEEDDDKDAPVKTSSSASVTVSSSSSSKDMKKSRKRRVVRNTFGSSTSASLWSSESGNLTTSFEDAVPKAKRAYTLEKSKALLKPWISN